MPGEDLTITLREYLERVIELRFESFKEYKADVEVRMEKLNDLRGDVVKDRALYLTRIEYDAKHEALEKDMIAVRNWQNRAIGIGVIGGVLSVVIGAFIGKVLFGH